MATKSGNKGRYITKVGYLDVYAKDSFKPKKELNPKIWVKEGNSYVLNSEVREKLLEISDSFIEFIGVDFFIHDLILTGSLANYNWSEYSDVDLHIIIDYSDIKGNDGSDSFMSIFSRVFPENFVRPLTVSIALKS